MHIIRAHFRRAYPLTHIYTKTHGRKQKNLKFARLTHTYAQIFDLAGIYHGFGRFAHGMATLSGSVSVFGEGGTSIMDLFGNASYRDSKYKLICKSCIHVAMLIVVAVELGVNRKVIASREFDSQDAYDSRRVAFGFIVTSGACIIVQIFCFIWRSSLYSQRKMHLMEVSILCEYTYI